jgi:hypothetical protein
MPVTLISDGAQKNAYRKEFWDAYGDYGDSMSPMFTMIRFPSGIENGHSFLNVHHLDHGFHDTCQLNHAPCS